MSTLIQRLHIWASEDLFGQHFVKPNFSKCGSHKSVARILEVTKCDKNWQKNHSMTNESYG
jgi:hypothetical protein